VRSVACRGGLRYEFHPTSTALLVIDMQRDFLDFDGMSAAAGEDVVELCKIIPAVQTLIATARSTGVRVIHTREGYSPDLGDVSRAKADRDSVGQPGPLGRFLIRGEQGHDFATGFEPRQEETVIDKAGFGGFFGTELESILGDAGVTHLILCGLTTQCCVHSTLREAVDRGFYCLTVADGCAAFEPEVHEAVLQIIQAENHLFGWIADTADVVSALG